MPNTLTNLIPDLYESLDVISRELVGMIPAVTLDASATRAAVNQTIRSFVAPASTASDITPGATTPNDGDQTIGNLTLAITKSRRVPIRWNGEETIGINSGPGTANVRAMQMQQAMRTLVNEIESDLAGLYVSASRAYGTAGTTPFGTANDYTGASFVRKILADNGAPMSDLQLVMDTAAGANLRGKQAAGYQNNDVAMLRQGVLQDLNGMAIRESGQIRTTTKGTGASYTSSAAGFAVGTTSIPIITGTGTVLAGDVITFAGDTNQYVVTTGVAAPGTIVIAAPGLRQAIPASATALTIVNTSTRNMAFHRSAIVLAQRLPALPEGGDIAADRTTIQDPRSGLSFEVAMYPQYRQMQYEISCAWGVKVMKAENVALLLG